MEMKKSLLLLVAAIFFCGASLCAQSLAGGQKDKSAQAQPTGKRPPQAKTHQEYEDYNTAYAVSGGAAMEKAAADFAAKYPESELRSYLYSKALHEYQSRNQSDKMQ